MRSSLVGKYDFFFSTSENCDGDNKKKGKEKKKKAKTKKKPPQNGGNKNSAGYQSTHFLTPPCPANSNVKRTPTKAAGAINCFHFKEISLKSIKIQQKILISII